MKAPKFSGDLRVNALADGTLEHASKGYEPSPPKRMNVSRVGATLIKEIPQGFSKPFQMKYNRHTSDVFAEVPPLAIALMARQDALAGQYELVDRFAAEVLGRRSTGQWRTAVSDALLGDWIAPLQSYQPISAGALLELRNRVWRIHADMQPIWTRRTGRTRVMLLDTPLGTDFTLHDLLKDSPSHADMAIGAEPDDARLRTLLRALSQFERSVVLSWMHPGVATWADAALQAGAPQPEADGERVRRRVRYLVRDQERRRTASKGLWLPGTADQS
ncbi:hypothetical protein [Streptomyces virginiae]|uniref:hypothetical protein n=1 Tax=Streptomyces virginiae TaxID=1961 RepID=UPI003869B998|nr:hypothetical protein OG253_42495 [Streptomyces virginiae]